MRSLDDRAAGRHEGEARESALALYDILDTPAEAAFDDLARAASLALNAPVALVNLVAESRQWFKAALGVEGPAPPLAMAFCTHAVRRHDLLVIPDTTRDPRTLDNPLVTGPPFVRFYAGMPLVTPEGIAVGTLCVLDTRPRALTDEQAFLLTTLARQVMAQLDLRRALRERRTRERRNAAILESAVDYGIFATDLAGRVTSWNTGARHLFGWSEAEMLGRSAERVFVPEDRIRGTPACEMETARTLGRANDERWHQRADGSRFWASGEMMPLLGEDGTHEGYLKILCDRTAQRRADEAMHQQTALLQTVTDHIGEAVFRLAMDGTITFANPAAEAMLGWADGALIGRNLHAVAHHHHPDGRPLPEEECPLMQALRAGAALRHREAVFFRRDGTAVDVVSSNAPIVEDGVACGAVLTVIDITQRKRAEERQAALVALGDRLRDLQDAAAIVATAAEITGRTLGLSRVAYGAVDASAEHLDVARDWSRQNATGRQGRERLADHGSYLSELRDGRNVVIGDVMDDPRTRAHAEGLRDRGIRSLINIPVVERGRLVAVFCLEDDRVRTWTPHLVDFARNVVDRTRVALARLRAEEEQELVNRELSHRMKNLLAMVQSIATQTMRSATDVETAKEVLAGRLIALGQAHDLLMGGALGSTLMAPVVRGALKLHEDRPGRFHLDGPDLEIGAKPALSLALMLHELATNAAKYGALSCETGHVAIRWSVEARADGPHLAFSWTEVGGPAVAPPRRKGFGTRFIERGLAGQVGGTIALAYPATGVTCGIVAPLTAFQADG